MKPGRAVNPQAWKRMVSCGEDETLYELCRVVYKDRLRSWTPVEEWPDYGGLWKHSREILSRILARTEDAESLEGLSQNLLKGLSLEEMYQWLEHVYDRAFFCLGEVQTGAVRAFPNQKGRLKPLWGLKRDRIPGEELKEIAGTFEDLDEACDIREYVLDRRIELHANAVVPSIQEMYAAVRLMEGYILLKVVYDYRRKQGVGITAYQDPLGRIAEGVMVNQEKGYTFWVPED